MSNKYIIAWVVGILIVGGGIYFLMNQNSNSTITPSTTNNEKPTPTPYTSNSNPTPIPAPVVNQVTHNVSITGFAFVPSTITVRKGETIVWTNKDSTPHTVTGGDLKSQALGQNETYSFAYDKTGTFFYHCSIHPSMTGTVIVTN